MEAKKGKRRKTFFKALRLASAVAPETDLQQDLAEFFKEKVETRSKGEITVTIFPRASSAPTRR